MAPFFLPSPGATWRFETSKGSQPCMSCSKGVARTPTGSQLFIFVPNGVTGVVRMLLGALEHSGFRAEYHTVP